MNYFKGTYYNGYSGCEESHYFIADNEEQVYEYMDEGLADYAEQYAHLEFGWDSEYTDEEYEQYVSECGIEIVEIDAANLSDFEEEECIEHDEWIDIC